MSTTAEHTDATLPFDEGLAVERKLFGELMSGTQSKAQQYYFFAEREAARVAGLESVTPRPVATMHKASGWTPAAVAGEFDAAFKAMCQGFNRIGEAAGHS